MLCVKIHYASKFLSGKARQYPYWCASLFKARWTLAGKYIWQNTGVHTNPRRSLKLAQSDGLALATQYDADFVDGVGSLHNTEVRNPVDHNLLSKEVRNT